MKPQLNSYDLFIFTRLVVEYYRVNVIEKRAQLSMSGLECSLQRSLICPRLLLSNYYRNQPVDKKSLNLHDAGKIQIDNFARTGVGIQPRSKWVEWFGRGVFSMELDVLIKNKFNKFIKNNLLETCKKILFQKAIRPNPSTHFNPGRMPTLARTKRRNFFFITQPQKIGSFFHLNSSVHS